VNEQALAPYKSYGAPAFAVRGYYQDIAFRCRGCGQEEIWNSERNQSGGMKSLRVTFTRPQSFAGRAARGNGPDARKRGVSILKASDAKDRRSSKDSR